jgi:hypothetical protein
MMLMDRDRAYAIPHEQIGKLLKHLHRTSNRHWHVALEEDDAGRIALTVPKTKTKVGLTEFEIVGILG